MHFGSEFFDFIDWQSFDFIFEDFGFNLSVRLMLAGSKGRGFLPPDPVQRSFLSLEFIYLNERNNE